MIQTWFGQYAGAYIQSTIRQVCNYLNKHMQYARNIADTGRLIPGTAAFKAAFNTSNC